jgi:hypothetical protein
MRLLKRAGSLFKFMIVLSDPAIPHLFRFALRKISFGCDWRGCQVVFKDFFKIFKNYLKKFFSIISIAAILPIFK